jgi:hypothetical protein
MVFHSPSVWMLGYDIKIGHDLYLPHHVQFIIWNHLSLHHFIINAFKKLLLNKQVGSLNSSHGLLYSVVVGYHCFRVPCCLHLQSEVNGSGKGVTDIGREYKWGWNLNSHKQPKIGVELTAETWCIVNLYSCFEVRGFHGNEDWSWGCSGLWHYIVLW